MARRGQGTQACPTSRPHQPQASQRDLPWVPTWCDMLSQLRWLVPCSYEVDEHAGGMSLTEVQSMLVAPG